MIAPSYASESWAEIAKLSMLSRRDDLSSEDSCRFSLKETGFSNSTRFLNDALETIEYSLCACRPVIRNVATPLDSGIGFEFASSTGFGACITIHSKNLPLILIPVTVEVKFPEGRIQVKHFLQRDHNADRETGCLQRLLLFCCCAKRFASWSFAVSTLGLVAFSVTVEQEGSGDQMPDSDSDALRFYCKSSVVNDRLAIELALQGAYIKRVDWVPIRLAQNPCHGLPKVGCILCPVRAWLLHIEFTISVHSRWYHFGWPSNRMQHLELNYLCIGNEAGQQTPASRIAPSGKELLVDGALFVCFFKFENRDAVLLFHS
nr:hypothetical protein Iba_chr02eCG1530 [Ipomoea batatas]